MIEERYLVLAYSLAVLTYYLGVLFYALPIPVRGVKKWGPILIRDGIYSLLLVFAFHLIVSSAYKLHSLLGHTWSELNEWVLSRLLVLVNLRVLTGMIGVAAGAFRADEFVEIFIAPISRILTYMIIVMQVLYVLAKLVQIYHVKLLLIGTLLFCVPLRLSRWVGAFFIAFALVFYVGLPMLPAFVSQFSPGATEYSLALSPPAMGVVFAEGEVLAASGDGVALAEVAFYDLNGELLAIYPTNVHGEFDAGPPDKGLPSEASFRAKLFAAGLVMKLSPDPIDPSKHLETSGGTPRLRLTASSLLWSPKPLVLVVANASKPGSVRVVESSPTAVVFTVNEPLDLIIRYPRGASVEVTVNGSAAPPDVTRSLEWRGVDLVDERFLGLEPGTQVTVKLLEYPGEPEPRLRTYNYLENAAGGELDFRNLELAIATFAVSWIIMPASYYIILLSIAYSLAYVIAGSREKVPITLPAP